MGSLRILKSGPMVTIQDRGRIGFRKYGIPQSGAMDIQSYQRANNLVGNATDVPAIEIAMTGIVIECLEPCTIACSGAPTSLAINGIAKKINTAFQLVKGDKLTIDHSSLGNYIYLAVQGNMDIPTVFGSCSTYLSARFGGMEGRALRKGDVLTFESIETQEGERNYEKSLNDQTPIIRMMKGPEWRLLKELPTDRKFTVHPSSNRMGIRLAGDSIAVDGNEIISSAVIPGTIQLPSNGLPIVLMNDCQTTGGYPRIGKVIDADLGKLAQKVPGSEIFFRLVD